MSNLDRELFEAARAGQHQLLEALVRQGADINAKHPATQFFTNITPLMVAAGSPDSNADTVRELIRLGAKLDVMDSNWVTAGWHAASSGDVDRLRLLLDAGCKANEATPYGQNAVHEAASSGDPERLALLIARGASILPTRPGLPTYEWVPATESTPGHLALMLSKPFQDQSCFAYVPYFGAVAGGNLECVKLILDQAFPKDFQDDEKGALHYAQTVEMTEFLWSIDVRPLEIMYSKDPVDEAFAEGHLDVAKFLLNKRSKDDDWQRYLDYKLVMHSGEWMSPVAVKILLDLGANPHWKEPGAGTALHNCCWQGDGETHLVEETLELLIAAGSDVNAETDEGITPLHEAIEGDWDSPTSVRVLLKHGANPNITWERNVTTLMKAAHIGSLEIIKSLLAAGVNPRTLDDEGRSALTYASEALVTLKRQYQEELLDDEYYDGHFRRSEEQIRDREEVIKILSPLT